MALTLFDTMNGDKRPFTPQDPNNAKVYVCGPTVYDYAHVGHARSCVVYDVLVRHLRASGQRVSYVRNVTDVNDKITRRAEENGESPIELARRFTEAYGDDMTRLGCLVPDVEPKVSEHVPQIIALVEKLIDKGHAYASDGDVYFSVESFPTYGKLSGRGVDEDTGASGRTNDEETARKRHPSDFALWKASPADAKEGHAWDSPWGKGRPGWHIECSAMSMTHLGETLDLHGGGLDLVFPHHENEIAQSEAATGCTFAQCWMHNGFVEVNKQKMGKSLGNFFTARELFKVAEPEAIRLFTMTVHYRAPLGFEPEEAEGGEGIRFPALEDAERRLEYLYKTRERLRALPDKRVVDLPNAPASDALEGFASALQKALDDDLNMPVALAAMSELLTAVNELCDAALRKKGKAAKAHVEAAEAGFAAIEAHLGLGFQDGAEVLTRIRDRRAAAAGIEAGWVEDRITARAEARAARDFDKADEIRAELTERGVELLDSPAGTTWQMS